MTGRCMDAGGEALVIACVDLASRAGARDLEIGYLDDAPAGQVRWYASARYRGARLTVEDQPSPGEAARALATRILTGGTCKCGQPVTLDDTPGCRWTLAAARWEPGCTATPLRLPAGSRGDVAAMNRAARRARVRSTGRRGL